MAAAFPRVLWRVAEILFITHQVSDVGVMRVLVELVRWDCGSKRPTGWKMRVSGVEETMFTTDDAPASSEGSEGYDAMTLVHNRCR